jgi:putative DNA primase/helicase
VSYEDEEYRAAMAEDGTDWQSLLHRSSPPKDRPDLPGAIKPTIHNACLLLRWGLEAHRWLSYDEFLGEPIVKDAPWPRMGGKAWTDQDALDARHRINSQFNIDLQTALVHDACDIVARQNPVHPVREYLAGLSWDGKVRINTWLMDYLGADQRHGGDCRRYLGLVGSWWLMGAVARVMKPGCRFDNVLIFEGKQGAFKSTALRILGGEWFLDTPIILGDKDAYQMLRGKWLIELAELDSFNKAESTKAKAFFSSPVDSYRPSYGRRSIDVPRQCVFAGTTNEEAYLRDSTGNRRYWPVYAKCIKPDELRRDRDQLWAEAYYRVKEGEPYWPEDEHRDAFDQQQTLRLIEDPWESVIGLWLAQPEITIQSDTDGITTHQVLQDAIKVDPAKMDERGMQMRVAKVLRSLGFVRREWKAGRKSGSRYVYVRQNAVEVGTGGDRDAF